MNTKLIEYKSLSEIKTVAKSIFDFGQKIPVWIFEGQMGAGKTTLIKAICDVLVVTSHVQSPTYSLVNEYSTKRGEDIYHFDFYRIKNEDEAMDIGVEDYLYSGERCFIEWPSKIANLLPTKHLKVEIQVKEDGGRIVHLEKVGV
ncbi:MAG: tRNA (adenosine(37)-N6)-threonylcarbamoyltransferase complex ATPase subunit type 1 TsaE [Bacteroidota bacterium]|jgi:tRNA threonylcarbamoyladenosine biosynthesis protein TsaE